MKQGLISACLRILSVDMCTLSVDRLLQWAASHCFIHPEDLDLHFPYDLEMIREGLLDLEACGFIDYSVVEHCELGGEG